MKGPIIDKKIGNNSLEYSSRKRVVRPFEKAF
jgi:hypothetical protein